MGLALDRLTSLDEAAKQARGLLHTPAEIASQPDVWLRVGKLMRGHLERLRTILADAGRLVLTGAGSSYFVGKALERALERRLRIPVTAIPSTEIVMDPEATLPTYPFVLVSFGRSGNSPEGIAVFELAERLRKGRVAHAVITCNPTGSLASLAGATSSPAVLCVLPPETEDKGLAMTASFTAMFVAALAMGYSEDPAGYEWAVSELSRAAGRLLGQHDLAIEKLAQQPFERAFFLGSGPFFGAALESRLKVMELTDGEIIGQAEDTLGLRHGPMAAINPRSLVVVFASEDPYRRQYETDLLQEIRAKDLGMALVVVCGHAAPEWHEGASLVIEFAPERQSSLSNDLVPPVLVLTGQLFGLFASIARGITPDAPSRGNVINRVVQGVRIFPYIMQA